MAPILNSNILTAAYFVLEENLKSLEPKEVGKWQKYLALKSDFYRSAVSILLVAFSGRERECDLT